MPAVDSPPAAEPEGDKPPERPSATTLDTPAGNPFVYATAAVFRPVRNLVQLLTPAEQPLELQIVGRTLFHAAMVGLCAGLLSVAFYAGSEILQNLLLEQVAGYEPLRSAGDKVWGGAASTSHLWLLMIITARSSRAC
jgi:hypothetical protein